jgi:spore germination protein YaaH
MKYSILIIILVLACSASAAPREVVGWYFASGSGPWDTVNANPDAISMLSPTWISIKGSHGEITWKEDPKVTTFAKEHGIKVVPLIWGSDKRSMSELFNSIEYRTRLVRNIVAALDGISYCQGINLDFEGLDPKDRYVYDFFLIELAAKLKPKGYLLTIDVPAKSSDSLTNSWAGAFDYPEIGRCCDLVMIMTYDEHWSTGRPGPVASVQMDDQTLAYATTVMPKEKILMGLPFYGYDWPEKGRASSSLYSRTVTRLAETQAKLMWDREAKTPWFVYTDSNGAKRTTYFENKASIAAKLVIAHKWDVGGICIWSLGNEDPGIWDAIRQYRAR